MQRAQRVWDNPALATAVAVANELRKPLAVFFGLTPSVPGANLRHYSFLCDGLRKLPQELTERGIGFVLRKHPLHRPEKFCREAGAAILIGDENPLREMEAWRREVAERVSVPFWTVDADVIVPSVLMEKEQYAARTIRPRIGRRLAEFLVPVGNPRPKIRWKPDRKLFTLDPHADPLGGFQTDRSVSPVRGFVAGEPAARSVLRRFVKEALPGYAERRNRPEIDGTSRLSPYLHFGQIGPHTVALAVREADAPMADREAFLEELIVRRELAVNFVRFNPDYRTLACAEPWAHRTLEKHRGDLRPRRYSPTQLEAGETHDPLWNAAQKQMVLGGWMHGYLRMYWAKKILEWAGDPSEAYDTAVALNDRYELDGRDPNGYAGIAWAVGGKHDRAWGPERPIFGTVRFMSLASTSRKFDWKTYVAKIEALEKGSERSFR